MPNPIKFFKARRAAKQALDQVVTQEIDMDFQVFATQAVLAILRHAMTALAPLGIVVTDDWMMQTAALVVGGIGIVWSLRRKAKAAKPA